MLKMFSPLSGCQLFGIRQVLQRWLPFALSDSLLLAAPSPNSFLSIFVHLFESHSLVCIGNHLKLLFLKVVRQGG